MQHRFRWIWMFLTVLVPTTMNERRDRVIGGSDAAEGNHPWIAFIQSNNRSCGATIISDKWMITAAHCFSGIPKKERVKTIWRAGFKKIIMHPKFDYDKYENDIALIKIFGKFPLNKSQLSIAYAPNGPRPNQWPPIGSWCTFVGWGCLWEEGPFPDIAQVVSLPIISNSECSRHPEELIGFSVDHEFCAGDYELGMGICSGDSGGGLIYDNEGKPVLVGILSSGHSNNPESYPAVFTRVSLFIDWINGTIVNGK